MHIILVLEGFFFFLVCLLYKPSVQVKMHISFLQTDTTLKKVSLILSPKATCKADGFFNLCKSSRLGPGFAVHGVWLICSLFAMSCTVLSPWSRIAGRKPCPGSYFGSN